MNIGSKLRTRPPSTALQAASRLLRGIRWNGGMT
jgi:hypothetical protein